MSKCAECKNMLHGKCDRCGWRCRCHRKLKPSRKEVTSARLDLAAVAFTTEQLRMHLSGEDDGSKARFAWLELQRAATAFVNARKRKS
jgi:hypothetical protein